MEALYDASQEDVATGGPIPMRGVFPSVKVISVEGVQTVPDEDVRAAFEVILGESPDATRAVHASPARETQDPPEAAAEPKDGS